MAVTLKFKAMGSAPMLNKDSYKIKTSQRFENVVVFLRNQLGLGPEIGLYLYVNFAFMPALDENVGNLWAVSKKSVVGVLEGVTREFLGPGNTVGPPTHGTPTFGADRPAELQNRRRVDHQLFSPECFRLTRWGGGH
jgi:hypothetical protein